METTFLIQPRQSGKTSKALYEYLKAPKDTIFVVHSDPMISFIQIFFGINTKNFTTPKNINRIVNKRGSKPKNIILDEYMYFDKKDVVWSDVWNISPENLYIFSTSDKAYSKELFDFVKENKPKTYNYEGLLKKYGNILSKQVEDEMYELYHNFLTDENTRLIDTNLCTSKDDLVNMKNVLGKERYNIEVLNKYLK